VLQPGDKVLGMNLAHGGHLTHGNPANFSGKLYQFVQYGVDEQTGLIDYDELAAVAEQEKPKMITVGASAYSRVIDFARMGEIARAVGAYLFADIAHIAGLVAAGVHPSPVPHADFVTTTTHKTLRGPRGGLILCKADHAKAINSAMFPGGQGGPLMHVIAAKAVCFADAMKPEFKAYARAVVENAKALSESIRANGLDVVSGGTDNHLMLVDLRPKEAKGKHAEKALDRASFDTEKPALTSGLRLGSPAGTTRGFGPDEFRQIGVWIAEVVEGLRKNGAEGDGQIEARVASEVAEMCAKFPIYEGM